ncbi:hypothetical protein IWQ60_010257 [Tieghemiomyces parasiticus]|uniref:Ima1 N-terminal domain-containing protein n=1 Tax=Tieghemiomyces parasiticus TaxID=78921 RepID=A0A9W7ZM18_9FUNG|nr:hypothetical protein IWQ60_010257 [Tieghemiomyces parasiticus]
MLRKVWRRLWSGGGRREGYRDYHVCFYCHRRNTQPNTPHKLITPAFTRRATAPASSSPTSPVLGSLRRRQTERDHEALNAVATAAKADVEATTKVFRIASQAKSRDWYCPDCLNWNLFDEDGYLVDYHEAWAGQQLPPTVNELMPSQPTTLQDPTTRALQHPAPTSGDDEAYVRSDGDADSPADTSDKSSKGRPFIPMLLPSPAPRPPPVLPIAFCPQCLSNQRVVLEALQAYPANQGGGRHITDPHLALNDRQIEGYRRDLEQKYPLVCAECQTLVDQRLYDCLRQNQGTQFLSSLKQSQAQRAKNQIKPRRPVPWYQYLLWIVGALASLLVWLLGAGGMATLAYSVYPESEPLGADLATMSRDALGSVPGLLLYLPVALFLARYFNPAGLILAGRPHWTYTNRDRYRRYQLRALVLTLASQIPFVSEIVVSLPHFVAPGLLYVYLALIAYSLVSIQIKRPIRMMHALSSPHRPRASEPTAIDPVTSGSAAMAREALPSITEMSCTLDGLRLFDDGGQAAEKRSVDNWLMTRPGTPQGRPFSPVWGRIGGRLNTGPEDTPTRPRTLAPSHSLFTADQPFPVNSETGLEHLFSKTVKVKDDLSFALPTAGYQHLRTSLFPWLGWALDAVKGALLPPEFARNVTVFNTHRTVRRYYFRTALVLRFLATKYATARILFLASLVYTAVASACYLGLVWRRDGRGLSPEGQLPSRSLLVRVSNPIVLE